MPTTVKVIGLKEANAALRQLPAVVRIDVQHVEDVTAFQVSSAASAHAPVAQDAEHGRPPGFLRKSIRWESRPRSLSAVVGVAAAAFYWKFLEYGTRHITARGFFRNAADSIRSDHRSRLIDALSRAGSKIAQMGK